MDTQNIDYENLLDHLGIDYDRKGDRLQARCPNPYHDDKDPSWSMDRHSGVHYCFSCGFKGTAAQLVYELTGMGMRKFLSQKGVLFDPFTYTQRTFVPSRQRTERDLDEKVREVALDIKGTLYSPYDNPEVLDFLYSLGANDNYIVNFDLKWARFIEINGKSVMSNRIIWPIVEGGKMISIEGRDFTLQQAKKVLYPAGGTSNTLWNIDEIDPSRPVIVVEGIKDAIKIWTSVDRNVVSTFGNMLTARQKKFLAQYPDIILFADNDAGGERMAELIDEIHPDREAYITKAAEAGKDPADLTVDEIKEALARKQTMTRYFSEMAYPAVNVRW